jgi:hypothetical protein
MKQFMFRALVTLDQPAQDGAGRQYPSRTRGLMVHASRIGQPSCDKYFPALISRDDDRPLQSGEPTVVTITVADDDAPGYLRVGQTFTLWGGGTGHGIVSRQVFTAGSPS